MKKILTSIFVTMVLFGCGEKRAMESSADAVGAPSTHSEPAGPSDENQKKPEQQIQSGQITAAEWNDLANWEFWTSLNKDSSFSGMSDYWGYGLTNRISVNLKSNDAVLADVPVELVNANGQTIWKSKTNNKGNAELWPFQKNGNQSSLNGLKVKAGDQIFENLKVYKKNDVNNLMITQSVPHNTEKKIDIAFVVDATGSMGDELEYLKVELADVVKNVKSQNPTALLQMGSVFYRDQGDEYVTKKSDLTSDIDVTVDFIKDQAANGGGDFPEAVEIALSESINELKWSADATSRILFLVLDAPPHYDAKIVSEIHALIELASSKGITIIPIVASGIDKETEFLMRYMAIATNGTYVFITNDSGIGNDHLIASVGPYQVEFLNKLMERLINDSLK